MSFALAPDLDVDRAAAVYARTGHVRLTRFLADPRPLADHLVARTDWVQVINSGATVYELDRSARAALTPQKSVALDAAVFEGARTGFQYRFDTIRVPDDEGARIGNPTPLNGLAAWMSCGEARAALRAICGVSEIDFADAQATMFGPGDFLTGHDDAVPGKCRHAAYVLGLTPTWRIEWGGLLLFHAEQGTALKGEMPGFNTLDLFAVPQMHSVSLVSPAAARARLSVTGWLRSRDG